jgi:hypothetical protein
MGSVEPNSGRTTAGVTGPHRTEEQMDPRDAALLDELTAALREGDSVPESLVEAAKDSWTWRTIDADLASLVGDTAEEPILTRAADDGPRMLTFTAGSGAVVLEVTAAGRVRRLLGQIVSPRSARVEVRHTGGSTSVEADEMGRFSVEGVPSGPMSLVCRFLDGTSRPLTTSWVAV